MLANFSPLTVRQPALHECCRGLELSLVQILPESDIQCQIVQRFGRRNLREFLPASTIRPMSSRTAALPTCVAPESGEISSASSNMARASSKRRNSCRTASQYWSKARHRVDQLRPPLECALGIFQRPRRRKTKARFSSRKELLGNFSLAFSYASTAPLKSRSTR